MREEVYEFLKAMGFTRDEIHAFQDENEKMFFTNLVEVEKNIAFLTSKGLNKEEIMQVFRMNPYMITVKNNRLAALDKILIEELAIDSESLKRMIILNPDTYISGVAELNKIIEYLKGKQYTVDEIKDLLINNPHFVSMSIDEFLNVIVSTESHIKKLLDKKEKSAEAKIISFEEHRKLLELQRKYEDGLIDEDDMTLEEIDSLHSLYQKQIKDFKKELARKKLTGK